MKKTMLAFGLAALLALSSTPAQADSAIEINSFASTFDARVNIGWTFTTNANITVYQLGFYDFRDNGLAAGHEVGLYDSATQTLLGWTIVDPNLSEKVDGFFYEDVFGGPIFLPANRRYAIQAVVRDDDTYVGRANISTLPEITYTGVAGTPLGVGSGGFALQYPTVFAGAAPGLFGPNFRTVPEPGAVALFGIGSLVIAYRRRRRKASRA